MSLTKSDPAYEARKEKRQRLKDDYSYYAPACLQIKPKSGGMVPFRMNKAQQELHRQVEEQLRDTGKIRALVLKGRQQGISTYVEGRLYWRVTHSRGMSAYILTHEDKATQNLYEMVQRYHDNCPKSIKPVTGATNARELNFSKLGSGYRVGTAGSKGTGRSLTLQYFHGSEVAFWPHADTHAMGVMQAVPREDGTEVFLESTANGIGNYFHAQWVLAESGESEYIPVFLAWFWQDEYKIPLPEGFSLTPEESILYEAFKDQGLTKEHLNWRRFKITELSAGVGDGTWRFKQEYPFTAAEAFQTSGEESLIDPQIVLASRKRETFAKGSKIVGVDPARFGDDATAIAYRQGRICHKITRHRKKSTMEVAGICANILRNPKTDEDTDIDMMFVDVGGLGAGVYDRLLELGFEDRVTAVNFGEKALEDDRYINKRSEMWCEMNEWLNMGAKIPDDDVLHGELCSPGYSYDSSQRVKLEPKESIRKRSLPSPDGGDALCLTFAYPVAPRGTLHNRIARQQPIDSAVGY